LQFFQYSHTTQLQKSLQSKPYFALRQVGNPLKKTQTISALR